MTVVDAYTRKCLAIHVDQGVKGEQVVDVIDRLLFLRSMPPDKIRVDNGTEFISKELDHWAYINRVPLDDFRGKIEEWRRESNKTRLHPSLGDS